MNIMIYYCLLNPILFTIEVQNKSCYEMMAMAKLSQHLTYIVKDECRNLLGYIFPHRNFGLRLAKFGQERS